MPESSKTTNFILGYVPKDNVKGGSPYPPYPGTRIHRYRCSLPGLTGFTTSRRGETDTGHRWPLIVTIKPGRKKNNRGLSPGFYNEISIRVPNRMASSFANIGSKMNWNSGLRDSQEVICTW